MPAPSLVDSCTKACIKNVRSITSIGDFEYWKIRTVLLRIDSPEQLHQIEISSPHIRGDDEELWRAFIARDIPDWRTKNYAPKNPCAWYEIYCKYKKEQQEQIKRDEDILRNTMLGLKKERETHLTKLVDVRAIKIPRDPKMRAHNGGVPIGKTVFRKEGPSTLNWTGGSKTKMMDGKGVLTRARREAKEISQMGRLSRPTHELASSRVLRAPAAMIKEHKTAAQPELRILSRRPTTFGRDESAPGISRPSLEEREARLTALKSGGAGSKRDSSGAVKETLVSFSSEDEDDTEDLFDEHSRSLAAPSKSSAMRYSSNKPTPASSRSAPAYSSSPGPSSGPRSKPDNPMITKPKPFQSRPTTPLTSSSTISRPKSNSPPQQRASPGPGPAVRPVIVRKKQAVDIFNRGAKKPRNR